MPSINRQEFDVLWAALSGLIPDHVDNHPHGGHRPRIPDKVVFRKIIDVLVLGCSYAKAADETCSATTIRRRRDEWIAAGVFDSLVQAVMDTYDRVVGFDLSNISVDGCIVKAPCGGEVAGRSPVDRGKQGTKRSLMVDGNGMPLGAIVAPANAHDSPLLEPTLDLLGRRFGPFIPMPVVHLDAGYDSRGTRALLDNRGYDWEISKKGTPLQAGKRWMVERTHAWHNRGFQKLARCTERRTEVVVAFLQLANVIILMRRLIQKTWRSHRWDGRSVKPPKTGV